MKKLMIAACAVALAGVVQAANYNWSVMTSTTVTDGWKATTDDAAYASATAQSGLAWMLIYSDANGGLSEVDALKALRGSGIDSKYVLASGTTGDDGKIAKTTFSTSGIDMDESGKLNAYLVILNDDDSFAYMGVAQAKAADTQGGTTDFSIAASTSKYQRDIAGTKDFGGLTKTGWYAIPAVPEPTSGLLLLLGVAGLALRRRRA